MLNLNLHLILILVLDRYKSECVPRHRLCESRCGLSPRLAMKLVWKNCRFEDRFGFGCKSRFGFRARRRFGFGVRLGLGTSNLGLRTSNFEFGIGKNRTQRAAEDTEGQRVDPQAREPWQTRKSTSGWTRTKSTTVRPSPGQGRVMW